jgi:hypothetical protein
MARLAKEQYPVLTQRIGRAMLSVFEHGEAWHNWIHKSGEQDTSCWYEIERLPRWFRSIIEGEIAILEGDMRDMARIHYPLEREERGATDELDALRNEVRRLTAELEETSTELDRQVDARFALAVRTERAERQLAELTALLAAQPAPVQTCRWTDENGGYSSSCGNAWLCWAEFCPDCGKPVEVAPEGGSDGTLQAS